MGMATATMIKTMATVAKVTRIRRQVKMAMRAKGMMDTGMMDTGLMDMEKATRAIAAMTMATIAKMTATATRAITRRMTRAMVIVMDMSKRRRDAAMTLKARVNVM